MVSGRTTQLVSGVGPYPCCETTPAAGDGGWRRGQRTGPTAWFDRLPRLTLRVAFVVCQELFRVMERIDSRLAVVEMWRR